MTKMADLLTQIIERYVELGETNEETAINAIADVLEEHGHVVLPQQYYDALVVLLREA